jgi:hypothetical protein
MNQIREEDTMKHIIHRERRSLIVSIVSAFLILCLLPVVGSAKLVICIDHDPAAEDGYLTSAEGYARTLATVPPDVICLDGKIEDCLANLVDGDSLILIAHGLTASDGTNQGRAFKWGGHEYTGFGTGTGQAPIPAGFANLDNIWFRIISCWSANDPDGEGEGNPDVSMVDKLRDAMGGTGQGHSGHGYVGTARARASCTYQIPTGLTGEALTAWKARIKACLEADPSWSDAPPTNRSDPPPVPNQRTAAQAVIVACEIDPPPVLGPMEYSPPTDSGKRSDELFADRGFVILLTDPEYCEETEWTFVGISSIPTLSEWAMIVMAVMLLAMMTWFVVRKRRFARSRAI